MMMAVALLLVSMIPSVDSFKGRRMPSRQLGGNIFQDRINRNVELRQPSSLYERISGGYNRGGYRGGGGRGYRSGGSSRGRSSR